MGKVLVVLVLLGAGGFALYKYVLKPQPAYDISKLEKVVDLYDKQFEGKQAALEGLAMGATMPASGQVIQDFFSGLINVLETYIDCESGAADMRALHAKTMQAAGGINQQAMMQEIMGASRSEQQAMVAKMALMYQQNLTQLLPLVEDYCDACPAESEVFNLILQF